MLHELEVPEVNYMLNAEFLMVKDDASPLSLGGLAAASPELKALLERRTRTVRSMDESGLLLRAREQARRWAQARARGRAQARAREQAQEQARAREQAQEQAQARGWAQARAREQAAARDAKSGRVWTASCP